MLVNKINLGQGNHKSFKGYEQEIDDVGKRVMRFNYPFDHKKEAIKALLEIYRLKENDRVFAGYDVIPQKAYTTELKSQGTVIDLENDVNLDPDESFAYKISINGQYVKDSGLIKDDYNIVSRRGTAPMVQGSGISSMPRIHRIGVFYKEDGTIGYNEEEQAEAEKSINTFSSTPKGNLASIEYDIPFLKETFGTKFLFLNPVPGSDTLTHHGYWVEDNMQLAPSMASLENYHSFVKTLFRYGMIQVYDAPLTSEGLKGKLFQYALRWSDRNPQAQYWFKMQGVKDGPLGLGLIPVNSENLRHKIINAPVIINPETNKKEKNPNYDENKDTIIQIYDASLVTPEMETNEELITSVKKIDTKRAIDINTHDDTTPNFAFKINPKEYEARVDALIEYNKTSEKPLDRKSAEGTMFIAQFSNFKIISKTEGGFVAWDANTDLAKKNFNISGFDEKLLQSLSIPERDLEKLRAYIGTREVQDMAVQTGTYWAQKSKDIQTLYVAQTVKNIDSLNELNKLIDGVLKETNKNGEQEYLIEPTLPTEARLTQNQFDNIVSGFYNFESKGNLSKDKFTIKSLMKLPIETLEFEPKTSAVLATSYFSNRATSDEQIGLSRFDLMEADNPHLLEQYEDIYIKVNRLYKNQLLNFADEVIKEVNEASKEKLIGADGEYTEYGEAVVNLLAPIISKYALLKSLARDKLKARLLADNQLSYNYDEIRKATDLGALGIRGASPEDEAKQLYNKILQGLNKLDEKDVDTVASSIIKQIEGTDEKSFRLAEAIVDKAGLGLAVRLDAAKDAIDMDAVRNGEMSFDDAWDLVIDFWAKFTKAIKAVNPSAYIVAEITDIEMLLKDIYGQSISPYDDNLSDDKTINTLTAFDKLGFKYRTVNDAMVAFLNKTGITSEAAYSYTFTDFLKIFSADFVDNGRLSDDNNGRTSVVLRKLTELIEKRGLDYVRNLFTFADNHDKPSVIHGMALDMNLFLGNFLVDKKEMESYLINKMDDNARASFNKKQNIRIEAMRLLTNSHFFQDMPLEAQLNIDNEDYFRTVSPKAVAMSSLFRNIINEDLGGLCSEKERNLLNEATRDLMNGNYLGEGENVKIPSVDIKEVKTLEGALTEILTQAGILLSEEDFNNVIATAKDVDRIKRYTIYGDFNTDNGDSTCARINQERAHRFVPDYDLMGYSTLTVAIAALLEESIRIVKGENSHEHNEFKKGGAKYIKKFNREMVESNRAQLPFYESQKVANRKEGYGTRDFRTVIRMLIEQAKYINSTSENKEKNLFVKEDDIFAKLFKSSTEPAVQKSLQYIAFLTAFPGIPTVFMRDILCGLGFDEKAKNVTLQNRNIVTWSELEKGPLKEYISDIMQRYSDILYVRELEEMRPLNNGTPYKVYPKVVENGAEQSYHEQLPAILMQDAHGNMAISIFNALGINPDHRAIYDKEHFKNDNIDTINSDNKYVPKQHKAEIDYIKLGAGMSIPVGTEFINILTKEKYVAKYINNELVIAAENGKIVLDGKTAKYGRMLLTTIKEAAQKGKRVLNHKNVATAAKKAAVSFKGNAYYNKQYNIVTNPYKKAETPIEGEKLSIVAR